MSNQLQITGGAKVRNLEGVLTGTSGVVSSVPLGAANGVATLDSGGKVPVSQLPSSVVTYLGTWNAATNTPTLTNGVGDAGDMYICNVAGTVNFGAGPVTFAVGDWVLYGSGTWQKSSGQNGTVTSVGASITGNAIGLTGSPITTAGTLAFAFAGTAAQYVNGAGNLTTFPSSQLLPAGGTTGQLLAKNSATNYDVTWIDNYTEQLRDTVKASVVISKGQAVYISGASGTNQLVNLASNVSEATSSKTLGLANQNFAINDIGQIITEGLISGIDTSTATAGDPVWLGVNGNLLFGLANKPVAPAHLVYIGVVTRVQSVNGEIYVKIQNGFELQELHNVSIVTPLNNQGLFYNSSNSLWENKSIATALGYTPANDASVVHLAGTETITGAKTFSGYTTFTSTVELTSGLTFSNSGFTLLLQPPTLGVNRTVTLPNGTGTLALTSDIPSITGLVPYTGATGAVNLGFNSLTTNSINLDGNSASGVLNIKSNTTVTTAGASYVSLVSGNVNQLSIWFGAGNMATFTAVSLSTSRTYTLPNASGTVALTSDLTGGTVTSVAALTIGTSGTDLSSSVANSTTTPVITLNVPTASATNRGALSSADWTTFNNKQNALTNPVTGTGTTNYLPKFTGTSTIGNSLIQDNGSGVGISTSPTAGYLLDVYGIATFGASATTGNKVHIGYGSVPAGAAGIGLWATGGNLFSIVGFGDTTLDSRGSYLLINPNGGNVGINTSTPSYQFDVNGTARASNLYAGSGTGAPSVQVFGGASSNSIGGSAYITLQDVTNTRFWGIQADASQKLNFWHYNGGWTSVANISSTGAATFSSSVTASGGNFGGGTPTGSTLFVNGTIDAWQSSNTLLRLNHTGSYGKIETFTGGAYGNTAINPSGGNILIGTITDRSFKLVVEGTDNNNLMGSYNTTSGASLRMQSNQTVNYIVSATNQLQFEVGAAIRMAITTGGNVLIGTTTDNTGKLQVNGEIRMYGSTLFRGMSSNTLQLCGGTSSSNVKIDGSVEVVTIDTNGAERMRITSGGAVCIGVTTAYGSNLFNVNGGIYATSSIAAVVAADIDMFVFSNTGASYSKSCVVASINALGGTGSYFFYGQQNAGTVALKIFSNGNIQNTNNSYGAISDARLKENITDATPKLDDLMKVKVRNYNLKGESSKQLGVISQELEQIFPNMIEESTNMGENMKIKGVKYSVFVPMLIKAVQELKAEIEILKNK